MKKRESGRPDLTIALLHKSSNIDVFGCKNAWHSMCECKDSTCVLYQQIRVSLSLSFFDFSIFHIPRISVLISRPLTFGYIREIRLIVIKYGKRI